MLQRLDYDREDAKPEEIRRRFDQELMVYQWRTPFEDKKHEPDPDRPKGAPAWWISDEEASQGTLAAMRSMGANV